MFTFFIGMVYLKRFLTLSGVELLQDLCHKDMNLKQNAECQFETTWDKKPSHMKITIVLFLLYYSVPVQVFLLIVIELQCFVKFKQRVVNSYAVVCVFQVCIIVKFNTPYSQHSCRVALHPLPYPPPYTIQLQSRLDNSQ